jgi:hypothetical protein
LDAGKRGDAFVVELLESGQVGGDDAEEVVRVSEEPLGLEDMGDLRDCLFV